jgi:hypothetical protein
MAWHGEAGVETVLDCLGWNADLNRTNTGRDICTAPRKLDNFKLPCLLRRWQW